MNRTIVIVALLAVGGAASAIDLYTQPPHTPGAPGGNGYSGLFGIGLDRQLADDFTVTGPGWHVNEFVSSWAQLTDGDANPVTSVNISIFNKSAGTVGSLVSAQSASVAVAVGPGTYFSRTERVITATISTVTLAPGDYYVMFQPVVAHNWLWLTSTPTTPVSGTSGHFRTGNGEAGWPTTWTATSSTDGTFNFGPQDFSLIVRGSAIPEPGSMIALGIGAVALLARRRRRIAA